MIFIINIYLDILETMKNDVLKNSKMLYVEDDESLRQNALEYFELIFDDIYVAKDGLEGLELFKEISPDIVITDIKMDRMTGLELAKEIRKINKKCQIIILTAYLNQEFLLQAVELNLVKYLIKPLSHEKLSQALNQCYNNIYESMPNVYHISDNCTYDFFNKTLLVDNQIVAITKKEMSLLELFCKNNNKVLSFEEIEFNLYYDEAVSQNAVRVLVKKLRAKLPKNSIRNIYNVGYKLECLK